MISPAKLYSNVIKTQNRSVFDFSFPLKNEYGVPSLPILFHQLIKNKENAVYRKRNSIPGP